MYLYRNTNGLDILRIVAVFHDNVGRIGIDPFGREGESDLMVITGSCQYSPGPTYGLMHS